MNVRQFAGTVKGKLRQNAVQTKTIDYNGLMSAICSRIFCGRGIGSIPFHEAAVHLFELAIALSCNKRFVAARIVGSGNSEPPIPEILSRFVFSGKVSSGLR